MANAMLLQQDCLSSVTYEQRTRLEADLRTATDKEPTALDAFLECHHLSMRIEFDGANKSERIFSACLPGMKMPDLGPGKSAFVIAHCATPATAVAALARALKGKTLRSDDGFKRADFPNELDAETLVRKLEPSTEVERQALIYVTDVAIRMLVPFSLSREAYDNLWLATIGASMIETGANRQLTVPISIVNENPLLAVRDMAWQLGGKLLFRREMEFHAPVLPRILHTLQEEIQTGEKSRNGWTIPSIARARSGAFGRLLGRIC